MATCPRADATVNSDKKRSGKSGPCQTEGMPLAPRHMMQVTPRTLVHMLTRPLMKLYPSQMMQLLGLWRLHRGRAPPLGQLEYTQLGQRMQLLARSMLRWLSRPGSIATQLHQLEPSRPLCPHMPIRLQQARRAM